MAEQSPLTMAVLPALVVMEALVVEVGRLVVQLLLVAPEAPTAQQAPPAWTIYRGKLSLHRRGRSAHRANSIDKLI